MMATHLVGVGRGSSVPLTAEIPFETRVTVSTRDRPGIACQTGVAPHQMVDCLMCSRFRGQLADEVRCTWSHRDPVSALMSCASALVTVSSLLAFDVAVELARDQSIHHLPVVDGGRLVGLLGTRELAAPPQAGERVADRMCTEIYAVHSRTTLGAALAAMGALGIGCLPVISDGMLIGIVTRADLRRIGVPEELLTGKKG